MLSLKKNITMKIISVFAISLMSMMWAQNNALILQDAIVVNITNGAVLNVAQTNPAGIVRQGTANGIIRSEGELNRVAWHINNATGTYNIPFGVTTAAADQLPFSYQVTSAGSNPGALVVSTYATASDNTTYPTVAPAVTNVSACWPAGSCEDRSLFAVDRFFILRKSGWSTEPQSLMVFPYRDGEWAAPNTITEANLGAQYWDNTKWEPGWFSGIPIGTADPTNNRVTGINAASNLYTWILVDKTNPLPVELSSFNVSCPDNKVPLIEWVTQSETNNAYFIISRSLDGHTWEPIATITGAGNSNEPRYYFYYDTKAEGQDFYYSLEQVDFDGTKHEGPIATTTCSSTSFLSTGEINVYGDQDKQVFVTYNSNKAESVVVEVFDAIGKLIYQNTFHAVEGLNTFKFSIENLPRAYYMIKITTSSKQQSNKLLLGNIR